MCILNGISQGIYQWLFVFLWALQPSPFFVGKIDGIPGGKETFWSGQHSSFKLPIHHQLVYNIPIFDGHITMFCWLNPQWQKHRTLIFFGNTIIIIYIYIISYIYYMYIYTLYIYVICIYIYIQIMYLCYIYIYISIIIYII